MTCSIFESKTNDRATQKNTNQLIIASRVCCFLYMRCQNAHIVVFRMHTPYTVNQLVDKEAFFEMGLSYSFQFFFLFFEKKKAQKKMLNDLETQLLLAFDNYPQQSLEIILRLTTKLTASYQVIVATVQDLVNKHLLEPTIRTKQLPTQYTLTQLALNLIPTKSKKQHGSLLASLQTEEEQNAHIRCLILHLLQTKTPLYLSTLMIHDWIMFQTRRKKQHTIADTMILLTQLVASGEIQSLFENMLWRIRIL